MIKEKLQGDMKDAMRARDRARLGVIRLMLAAINQREVDDRVELDDNAVLAVLDKMLKQRRDSKSQYEAAKRQDLADQEIYEMGIIQSYLPQALTDTEIEKIIDNAINETGASSPHDMGKVMGILKAKAQGRCDMRAVSGKIKARLSSTNRE